MAWGSELPRHLAVARSTNVGREPAVFCVAITRRTAREFQFEPGTQRLADLVDMHGHRRVAIAGGRAPAKALVEVLAAAIIVV